MWKSPPEICAICCMASVSSGTGICSSLTSIDPWSVPNAITDTGTLASAARCAASCSVRPTVRLPSVISTIRAGGGAGSPASVGRDGLGEQVDGLQAEMIASPVAVRSSSLSPAMACLRRGPIGGRR